LHAMHALHLAIPHLRCSVNGRNVMEDDTDVKDGRGAAVGVCLARAIDALLLWHCDGNRLSRAREKGRANGRMGPHATSQLRRVPTAKCPAFLNLDQSHLST
jgi:hypothetical protein